MMDFNTNPPAILDVKGRSMLRPHKRTLAILFALVVLPWSLIAVCGTPLGSYGFFWGTEVQHSVHGWPLLHSQRFDLGSQQAGAQLPVGGKTIEDTKQALRDHCSQPEVQRSLSNLRLKRLEVSNEAKHTGWSDLGNWPFGKRESLFVHEPIGWIVNSLVLVFLLGGGYALLERRIRKRGSLLQFQLRTLLALTAVLAIGLGLLTHLLRTEYVRNERSRNIDDFVRQNDEVFLINNWVERETTLPGFISQLLNHGETPWLSLPGFTRIKSGSLEVGILNGLDKVPNRELAIEALENAPLPIQLSVVDYDLPTQETLRQIRLAPVESLYIEFSLSCWIHGFQRGVEKREDYEVLKARAGNVVQLEIEFRNLRELTVQLDCELDQSSQIRPFLDIKTLEKVRFYSVSQAGAEFLLKNRSAWPANSSFEFEEDVPAELIQRIREGFSPEEEHPGLRSVVPVVG